MSSWAFHPLLPSGSRWREGTQPGPQWRCGVAAGVSSHLGPSSAGTGHPLLPSLCRESSIPIRPRWLQWQGLAGPPGLGATRRSGASPVNCLKAGKKRSFPGIPLIFICVAQRHIPYLIGPSSCQHFAVTSLEKITSVVNQLTLSVGAKSGYKREFVSACLTSTIQPFSYVLEQI